MMKEVNLFNKRILYLNEESFHYDTRLVEKLTELGAYVDYFHIVPDSIHFRMIKKFRLPGMKSYLSRFNSQMFLKQGYDYVLVRYGMQFDSEFFTNLRRLNPEARFINFHWDSIRPEYNYLDMIKYFDKIYSFDPKDCLNHAEIQYLPLFYLDEYETFRTSNSDQSGEIDVLFVGNWRNYERYKLIKATEDQCKQNQLRFYYYLYYPVLRQFRALRKGIIPREAKHKFLSHNEILNLFSKTNTVIDFPSSFQTGLTMRTFETLAAGKKLITTNRNILNEPFYNSEHISILDIKSLKLDVDFIRNIPTTSLDGQLTNYSIKNYINQLLQ